MSVARALARRLYAWATSRKLDHDRRYSGYGRRALAAWRHRHLPYQVVTLDEVRRRRVSDTLFVIGSGPSVLDVTEAQWKIVARHASWGINFSYLLDVVPTYQIIEDGKSAWLRSVQARTLAPRRRRLSDTIWFVSHKQPRRGIHPRYAPEMFPEHPTVCVYPYPEGVRLERDRPFRASDFERSLVYRGTMSVTLHLASRLGYRRIVLLGVDLHTMRHFFDGREEMRDVVEYHKRALAEARGIREGSMFPQMIPLGNKFRPADDYLVAVSELYFRPRGIELSVGHEGNLLSPRLPVYSWEDGR